ncbi:RluA family pseudouridine synthase [uncultured Fenollaria sp.]|uniref:RluA family pseudouridine synthase n=1 Tax=uncultured Fenollaria sp. TaxID=1686315 RepID=UPI0025E9B05F|nr:RluA family pseudouridine synthase [uncultured Fenollaria sp.]
MINDEYNVSFVAKRSYDKMSEMIDELKISKRLFRRSYLNKDIYVNEEFRRKDLPILMGEVLRIHMPEEETAPDDFTCDIDIIDETIDYMVINKEKNILVHETKNNQGSTLYNALINLFQSRGLKRRVRLVNRLDMNTTGLMVVAKNPFAHYNLMQQMEDGSFKKKYHAVVDGSFPFDEIVVRKNIKTDESDHIKKMVCDDGDGDYAKTIFKKVISGEKYSIVEAELITGRTHQIRLHLAYLGFPIVGDTLYNDKTYEGVDRQLLHSFEISFKDPRTNEERHYEVSDHADIINFSKKFI